MNVLIIKEILLFFYTFVCHNELGTFNSWVMPRFVMKGGDKMLKKDFLILSLIIIILLLIGLLFVTLK